MKDKININSVAIKPLLDEFETQIVLQRHCNYDRVNGNLLDSSIKEQEEVALEFLKGLEGQELDNIYFLFIASDTINANGIKQRSVDTINIAMQYIKTFLNSRGISLDHIINFDENLNYKMKVKQTNRIAEPRMLTDKKGYLEFLKEKNNGMNQHFWIDFEEDTYKEKREQLNAEGPDEIVSRGVHYINVLQRFAKYFHEKKPSSKLIVWCGTHYDLLSPLAKQTIFDYEKSDFITVDYCGGISFLINQSGDTIADVNGQYFPVSFEGIKQHHRHL